MSLIIGRASRHGMFLLSDTLITHSSGLRSGLLGSAIKINQVTDNLSVAWAGNEYFADQALAAIPDSAKQSLSDFEEYLYLFHKNSLSNGNAETEFLICSAKPNFKFIEIKNSESKVRESTAWIGSQNAFSRFRDYESGSRNRKFNPAANFRIAFQIQNSEETSKKLWAAFEIFKELITDNDIPEVGGFVVPFAFNSGKFSCIHYTDVNTPMRDFSVTLPDGTVPISGGLAWRGDYTCCLGPALNKENYVIVYLQEAMHCILFDQKNSGLIFSNEAFVDTKLFDFESNIRQRYGIEHGLILNR